MFFVEQQPKVGAEGVGTSDFHFAGGGRQRLPLEGSVTASAPSAGGTGGLRGNHRPGM